MTEGKAYSRIWIRQAGNFHKSFQFQYDTFGCTSDVKNLSWVLEEIVQVVGIFSLAALSSCSALLQSPPSPPYSTPPGQPSYRS